MSEIAGWMKHCELDWLSRQAAGFSVIVEFGSWKGRSSVALARACPGALFCVDYFRGALGSPCYGEAEEIGGPERIRGQFLENLKPWIKTGRVFLLDMTTAEAANVLEVVLKHRRADMIFVDADHSYEAVKHDVKVGMNLLRPNGLLCGHDLQMAPVRTAVAELLPGFGHEGNIWHWRKP